MPQQPSTHPMLESPSHGKSRVRVARVRRNADGTHYFAEYSVQIQLRGGTDRAFTHADNRNVVATDTCKNHVYMLARTHDCNTPERFALALSDRFLREYAHVDAVDVDVVEKPWIRFTSDDQVAHRHGFRLLCNGTRGCAVHRSRTSRTSSKFVLRSCLIDLSVLKTTQSGWEKFLQDRYTTLPETRERILATTIDAKWSYALNRGDVALLDFDAIHAQVKQCMLTEFFGPPDAGHYSNGVQECLYNMGSAVVNQVEQISSITLSLPNIHFLPCNLPVFKKNGVHFQDDVYIPTDEPHGIIQATICRFAPSKL